jgi:O-antigen ligase
VATIPLRRADGSVAPPLLTLYLTGLLGLFGTHLDLYLNHTGALALNLVHLLLASAGAYVAWLVLGPGSEPYLRRFLGILHAAAWPLLFLVLWLFGHVLFLGGAPLPPETELAKVLPFLQLLTLVLGLALPAAPGFPRALRIAGAMALALLGATVMYDALRPGTFSLHPGRAAGFAMDANVAAFALMLLLAVAVRFRRPGLLDHAMVVCTLIAVFFTFSRGGLILLGVFALFYLANLWRDRQGRPSVGGPLLLAGGLAASLLALSLFASSLAVFEQPTVRTRLDQLTLRAAPLADDASRLDLFFYYADMVAQRPFLGHGTGTSIVDPRHAPHGQGPHNMFLRVWVDHGLWGLVTYSGFLLAGFLLCRSRRHAAGVCICALAAVYSLVSHTVIDDKTFLLVFGIALGTAAPLPRQPERLA